MVKKKIPKKETVTRRPRRIKIRVVGIGGGGAAIVSEMAKSLKGASFLIADTDTRTFKKVGVVPKRGQSPVRTFQFGENLTYGLGTGLDVELGQKAAEKEKGRIEKIFKNQDLSILVASLGGGVGSGASLVFAKAARNQKGIIPGQGLCLGIFTLPFSFEGEKKMRIAKTALKKLREDLSGTIVLSNEKIFKLSDKKTPLKKALSSLNQVLIGYLKDLIEMISLPGIINIDFADLRTILKGRGRAIYFGRGVAQGPNRAEEALKKVFQNPLGQESEWGVPLAGGAKRILFNITGGKDLGLKEVEEISRAIAELNPRAKIIFGISQKGQEPKRGQPPLKITLLAVGEEKLKIKNEKLKIESQKKKNSEIAKTKTDKGKKIKVGKPKKKAKIRRSGLEIKKAEAEAEEKEREQETQWEIPSFLRRKLK
ncbi:MAG TPA: hypothetical protein ENI51_09045 [Candidatus Atribacteria bacterium]|nr:hypothetical protein [Candidatus Atribacteria bacterium]